MYFFVATIVVGITRIAKHTIIIIIMEHTIIIAKLLTNITIIEIINITRLIVVVL